MAGRIGASASVWGRLDELRSRWRRPLEHGFQLQWGWDVGGGQRLVNS